ncbi:MAG: thiol:disulfide interchange protein DsbA/DsbL [Candidatus Competibacterales bacterium]
MLFGLVLAAIAGVLIAATFEQGTHYQPLADPQRTDVEDGQIEVIDFFWYGCPHCYRLNVITNDWTDTLGDDVVYRKIPAVFNQRWARHAQVFYTAEALGILDRAHDAIFNAIHSEKKALVDEGEIAALFEDLGVVRPRFESAFNSFTVNNKVRQAADLSRRYRLDGVPALIINGKYRTGPGMAQSYPQMLQVVEQLIDQERQRQDVAAR